MARVESTEWREIKGYAYRYRIGDMGNVQRQLPDGTWRNLKPYKNKKNGLLYVGLRDAVGHKINKAVVKLMDEYFFNNYAKRNHLCRTHKNGMTTDCSKYNIIFVAPSALNYRNTYRNKPVVKIDANGNIVARYASLTEAANANYMSRESMSGRCNNKLKHPERLDGYTYRFEADVDD